MVSELLIAVVTGNCEQPHNSVGFASNQKSCNGHKLHMDISFASSF